MRRNEILEALWSTSLALVLLLPSSCSGPMRTGDEILAAPAASTAPPAKEELSGSELWSQTCHRCHFNRSPSWYSDAEWDVALFHMGVKAHLTRAEREAVLRYLKAAN